MKIDAQTKIAELEQRIVALEEAMAKKTTVTTTRVETTVGRSAVFGKDWDNMWASFEQVMKNAFGR